MVPEPSVNSAVQFHFLLLFSDIAPLLQLSKTLSFSFCRSAPISAVQFKYSSANSCSNFPVSASAVSLSVSVVHLRKLPFLPGFLSLSVSVSAVQFLTLPNLHSCSKPFSLSVNFYCSVSSIQFQIMLCFRNFSKSFQSQFLLFRLRFCCSISDIVLLPQLFKLSVSVSAV